MGSALTEIIVDAIDAKRLARFWADVLGWGPTGAYDAMQGPEGGVVEIGPPGGARPTLVFVPVEAPKTTKNRVHLDVAPTGCDQDEELARLCALGAVEVDVGQGDQPWIVLADPEGNEFCLLRPQVD